MAMLEATIHYSVKKSLFQTFRTSRAFSLDSHNEENDILENIDFCWPQDASATGLEIALLRRPQ